MSEQLSFFQILPRLVFVESTPINVVDIIIPLEQNISLASLYAYFTGNAVGGVQQVTMSGINATVMAGKPQFTYWATLYGFDDLNDLQYNTYLLISGGCRASDICSVIFSKPDLRLRKTIKIASKRKISVKRALVEETCTILFFSDQALHHQFIVNFRNSRPWAMYPEVQLGFADIVFPNTVMKMGEQTEFINQSTFSAQQNCYRP